MPQFNKLVLYSFASGVVLWSSVSTGRMQTGGGYELSWSVIAGGGGTTTSSHFVVSSTIGQPAAGGPMVGGQFTLYGGFWALPVAVQSPGAPALVIVPGAPGQAQVSWNPATPGFVLQESVSLSPPNWTNSVSAQTNPVIVPLSTPARFYRLIKP